MTPGERRTLTLTLMRPPVCEVDLCVHRSVVVFNPTEQRRVSIVSIHVSSADARVVDAETGRPVPVQISAVWAEPSRAAIDVFQVEKQIC